MRLISIANRRWQPATLPLICALLGAAATIVTTSSRVFATQSARRPGVLPDTTWQKYVVGPTSRDVHPLAVLSTSGEVVNPNGVLGRGITKLQRPTGQDAVPSVTVDFGKVVVGYPTVSFAGASGNNPGVRVAFSETLQYLTDRSDFTRSDFSGGPGTDQYAVPVQAVVWTDTKGCDPNGKVCADGLHGFRYLKISLDALPNDAPDALPYGEVDIDGISLNFTAYLGTPDTFQGWFDSSDAQLNQFWYGAAYTNELVTDTFRSTDVWPLGADSPSLDGKVVLLDGAKRDRDPYVADLAVSGRTEYLTHNLGAAVNNVLADLADHQRADGWIPPASVDSYTLPVFEYPLWWVVTSWDYVLYTGDLAFASHYYPNLTKLLDGWYPSVTDARGLLQKGLNGTDSYIDYDWFLPRSGEVTYYNALYALALQDAGQLANALGQNADATRWLQRKAQVSSAINDYLWDPSVGAYLDMATGPTRHAQDGNALAILAGVASSSQAVSALSYLNQATVQPYGDAAMDNDTLWAEGTQFVSPFISALDIEARFQSGQTNSAIDEIKRLYGWMAERDPGTTDWEGIGPGGSLFLGALTSAAHGWSTGVVPALSNYLLGIMPTGVGFSTWIVQPHPGNLTWAQGQVPTPHGPLGVSWSTKTTGGVSFRMTVIVPEETLGDIAVPAVGTATKVHLDGSLVFRNGKAIGQRYRAQQANGYVTLLGIPPGHHTLMVNESH